MMINDACMYFVFSRETFILSRTFDYVNWRACYNRLLLECIVYLDHIVSNGRHLKQMLFYGQHSLLLRYLHLVHVGKHGRDKIPVLLDVVDALL